MDNGMLEVVVGGVVLAVFAIVCVVLGASMNEWSMEDIMLNFGVGCTLLFTGAILLGLVLILSAIVGSLILGTW